MKSGEEPELESIRELQLLRGFRVKLFWEFEKPYFYSEISKSEKEIRVIRRYNKKLVW